MLGARCATCDSNVLKRSWKTRTRRALHVRSTSRYEFSCDRVHRRSAACARARFSQCYEQTGCSACLRYQNCARDIVSSTKREVGMSNAVQTLFEERADDVEHASPPGDVADYRRDLRGAPHARSGRYGMNIWTEFKNAILPWLLAGAVVTFLIAEHRRTTGALLDANTRLANAVEQQGKALDGVRALLASQGYTLPPLAKPQ